MFLVNKEHLSSCPVTLLLMLPQVLDGALSVPCHLLIGSLSKHDLGGSENVTWKCNFYSRFCNHFSVIQSHYAWKCVLTILELNWNQRLGHKKTKLNICHHMLTSSTQLQNRSFHVVERTRTSSKCQKMKYARAKRPKILFFTVKYANLWDSCCHRRRGCLSSLLQTRGRRVQNIRKHRRSTPTKGPEKDHRTLDLCATFSVVMTFP